MRRTKVEKEFCELGWRLIELKVAYYKPELVHESWLEKVTVSDDDYDAMEQRYLELCRKLSRRNTVVHKKYPGFDDVDYTDAMMEVDTSRQSVQLVIYRLGLNEQTRRAPRK